MLREEDIETEAYFSRRCFRRLVATEVGVSGATFDRFGEVPNACSHCELGPRGSQKAQTQKIHTRIGARMQARVCVQVHNVKATRCLEPKGSGHGSYKSILRRRHCGRRRQTSLLQMLRRHLGRLGRRSVPQLPWNHVAHGQGRAHQRGRSSGGQRNAIRAGQRGGGTQRVHKHLE